MIGFHTLFQTAAKAGLACAALGAIYAQPYRMMMVVGSSMAPTYQPGSLQLTEPVSPNKLAKGMVVLIDMKGGTIVKRIAFMPGDKIMQMKTGATWFDMIYVHPTTKESLRKSTWRNYVVPPGYVYVLGDNQPVSQDSKTFGCVPMSEIKRKLVEQHPFDVLCETACPESWLQS
jgi:signal peptidase I